MIDSDSPAKHLVFEVDGKTKAVLQRLPSGDIYFSTFWGETRITPGLTDD